MRQTVFSRTAVFAFCLLVCAAQAFAAETVVNPVKRGLPMQPPRALLQKMFPEDPLYLSLSGGWGYEQTEPVVFTTPKELAGQYFDTEPLEYGMVDFRNYEEFVGARPESQKMVVMGIDRGERRVVRENGRVLSCITAQTRVISPEDFKKLSSDVEQIDAKDLEARKALEARVVKVSRTYWFDLTEPFAHNEELESKGVKSPANGRR